jgi:hypothetical protein
MGREGEEEGYVAECGLNGYLVKQCVFSMNAELKVLAIRTLLTTSGYFLKCCILSQPFRHIALLTASDEAQNTDEPQNGWLQHGLTRRAWVAARALMWKMVEWDVRMSSRMRQTQCRLVFTCSVTMHARTLDAFLSSDMAGIGDVSCIIARLLP